jgi:ankyrin repeat protein
MMRKNPLFILLLCGIGFLSIITSGCATDVWTLIDRGESEKARELFLGKTDVHAVDSRGRTPLHAAAEARDTLLVNFFISLGADVHARDNQNRTPLTISAENRDAASARALTLAGSDIHYAAPEGISPALTGIREDHDFLAAILTPNSIYARDPAGQTILHLAAAEGNVQAVDSILNAGNSINERDNQGKTALDLALERTDSQAHAETAERLIREGADSENPLFPYFAPAVRSANYDIRTSSGIAPLHFTAQEGYAGYVGFLIDKGADVNIKSPSGTTPLHEAARSGNISIMEMLLENGAEINTQDAKGNSVLHIAIPPETNQEALYLFLFYGANPNLKDEHGDSPLHIAIMLNRGPEIIRSLLENGADVSIHNIEGKTPLFLAVEAGRAQYISPLLEYHSDIFAVDNSGITPLERAIHDPDILPLLITEETVLQNDNAGNTILHVAVRNHSDPETIDLILDRNARINARNKEGDTALHLAVRQNDQQTGELLIRRGANIFDPNASGESPLYQAFHSPGNTRDWIVNPDTLASRDGLGNSILHYAAQWKLDSVLPRIIQRGADLEAKNATGETPLFVAVKYDSPSTIQVLRSAGASVYSRDTLGNSLLHAAVRWNAPKSAEELIASGAEINVHALNGKTPLHDAVRLGISEIEPLLTQHGADLEARDAEGNTPFMEAVMAGFPTSVERLGALGSDPATRNNRGETPLHIAVAMERSDLIIQLLKWNTSIHARNSLGRTPFQMALGISPRMVTTVLSQERISTSDDNGASPLHIAINEPALREPGALNLLQTIIDQGARLSAVDSEGRTPLRLAVDQHRWDVAKLLADAGSDVFSFAKDGKTPAEFALANGQEGIMALFSGETINARDAAGNSILHYAARMATVETTSHLIELGADKNVRNIAGESPPDIARRWNRLDLASILEY